MALLDWLQSNFCTRCMECFAVHDDLNNAEDALAGRTHLLPMSDASLFHFFFGVGVGGFTCIITMAYIGSHLETLFNQVSTDLSAPLIIRVPVSTTVNLDKIAGVSAYSIVHDDHRNAVLNAVLQRPGIHVILESLSALALHRLENRFLGLQTESSTLQPSSGSQCTVVALNQHVSLIEEALSGTTSCDVISLHQVSNLDTNTLESIQRTGRVICVGLPTSWMSSIIKESFGL